MTNYPRKLKKMDSFTVQAAYDPRYIPTLIGMVNLPQTITITYPNGDTNCFYGALQKIEWGDMKIGEFPEGTFTIMVMNCDPANNLVEAGPVYTSGGGTA